MRLHSLLCMVLSHMYQLVIGNRHPDGWKYKECLPTEEKCEFWLLIVEKLTMIFHKDLVYADGGKLYLYNEHPLNYTTEVICVSLMPFLSG